MADETTRRSGPGLVIGIGLLMAALLLLLLRPGSIETQVLDEPTGMPDPSGQPMIAVLRAPGGFSLFGLQIVDATHYVEVRFTTAAGCSAQLEPGDPWPSDHEPCSGPSSIAGTVGGLGVSADGSSIVGVEFTVSGACHDRLELGMPWPVDHPDC